MVGQSDYDRIFGRTPAVYAPANAGDGWQHGCQAVCRSNVGVKCVRLDPVGNFKVKSIASPRIYCANCYYFYSFWRAVCLAVRIRGSAQNSGAERFTSVAQCRQHDVFAAVGVRCSDVLEIDVASCVGNLSAELTRCA